MKHLTQLLFIAAAFLLPSCATTQSKSLRPVLPQYDIEENVADVHIDNLQNIYILTTDNKVVKYTESLERQFDYSNNLIGNIESIDATNPQKILCFVKDFNRILVLDNTLAEINWLDLSTSDYLDVSVVARTNDNQIWLFDPINQVLVKVNELIEEQYSSNRLTDLNLGSLNPVSLKEKENIVVMSDPEVGILIFDNFGQFLKLIPEKGVEHFQIFGDYLFFTQDDRYYQYHIKRYEKSELTEIAGGFEQFVITQMRTYLINQDGIVVQQNRKK